VNGSARTAAQQELLARLSAIARELGWSPGQATISVAAGPNAFDVQCVDGDRTIWHWVGTREQITVALDNWIRVSQPRRLRP
jgi:hypothetical protein